MGPGSQLRELDARPHALLRSYGDWCEVRASFRCPLATLCARHKSQAFRRASSFHRPDGPDGPDGTIGAAARATCFANNHCRQTQGEAGTRGDLPPPLDRFGITGSAELLPILVNTDAICRGRPVQTCRRRTSAPTTCDSSILALSSLHIAQRRQLMKADNCLGRNKNLVFRANSRK